MRKQRGTCSVVGCFRPHNANGYCRLHWARWKRNGTPDRIRAVNQGVTCKLPGCDEWAWKSGVCRIHYGRWKRRHSYDERKVKINHPLYCHWQPRKKAELLAPEWHDFWAFIETVGVRPSKNHFLDRPDVSKLFGPENWEWREKLAKRPDETKQEWWARKWQSRREHFPTYETGRWYKRKYGITLEQYEEFLEKQKHQCAICRKPETSFEFKSGKKRRLAVDHCHDSLKVRGLLCFRCNSIIGKAEDDVGLLKRCIAYLRKHA